MIPTELETLRARTRELEALCADVYVAGVELGLPEPLLSRLWKVVGQGTLPQAFVFDMPADAVSPASTAATRPPGREPREAPARPELTPLPARRVVMVVDDDPRMLEVLTRILRRENYELVVAGGGLEAMTKAGDQVGPIDLLVTDCMMPDLKGPDLAVKLRDRYPGIKVLYQTGFSDTLFDDALPLDDGSAFLEKPFTSRGLREAARLLLFGVLNP